MSRTPYVAVVGPGEASPDELSAAEEIGAGLAAAGSVVVTGGLGGVMEAACRGARSRRGGTVGILPREDRDAPDGRGDGAVPAGAGGPGQRPGGGGGRPPLAGGGGRRGRGP